MSLICDKLKELVTIPFKSKKEEKSEGSVVQKQTAGEGATQIQANNINYFVGIDENRAREIAREVYDNLRGVAVAEATNVALDRVRCFENEMIARLTNVEGALNEFKKPEFQHMIGKAQRVASLTERKSDYDLLAELLACRLEKGGERKVDASISHAVEIVNEVDDDALCALTVVHAIGQFIPASGDITIGLNKLDELFESLMCCVLPTGNDWLEHLEMLNLIRVSIYGSMRNFEDIYCNSLDGYLCVGIKKDSEEFIKAVDILKGIGFQNNWLIEHSLLEGYVRLPVVQRSRIKELQYNDGGLLCSEHINELNKIWELYSKDSTLANDVRKKFLVELGQRNNLIMVKEWWNKINIGFNIKQSGKVLAHVNAKRLNDKLPDLI